MQEALRRRRTPETHSGGASRAGGAVEQNFASRGAEYLKTASFAAASCTPPARLE